MTRTKMALVAIAIVCLSAPAFAQSTPPVYVSGVPRGDISLGFNYVKANAPPGGCECFGLTGGYISGSYRALTWISVAAEYTGGHANDISTLGQDLTLQTYTAGPRFAIPRRRIVPYIQALFGAAHASDSYFPTANSYSTTATSFAMNLGGGIDINLTHRLAIRAIQAEYLHTSFPNGSDGEQNHLMLGAGVVFRFGDRPLKAPSSPYVPEPTAPVAAVSMLHREIAFSCSTNVVDIQPGQTLDVLVSSMTEPDGLPVTYTWETTGGTIQGSGTDITLNTTGMEPGRYRITGHAVADIDSTVSSSCEVSFRVEAPPAPMAPMAVAPSAADLKAEARRQDDLFHANVPDAFFDYDKWDIRPDTQVAIQHAAEYLTQHPEINVLIGGYSDERGSSEYNLALGLKRSDAVREALIRSGIDGDRIQVISYGKGTQVCTTQDEACWQQNRRAAFSMHP